MKRSPIGEGLSSGAPTQELSSDHQDILDNMKAVDSTIGEQVEVNADVIAPPSPEAQEFAIGIGGVPLREALESDPYAVAGTDQAEAHANDPENSTTEIPFAEAKVLEKSRAAESVDAILAKSNGINLVERVKLARAEKRWRADVRAVNKPAMNQEIRDAKAKLTVAKDTYGFRGRQVLRKQGRNVLKTEIDQRRAEGKLNFIQSRLAKMNTYGAAKRTVQEQSNGKIEQAEGIVDSARTNKRLFLDRNGRRSNTPRKNYGRIKTRTANEGYYSGSGYLSGDRQPLTALYNSSENEKKRQAARDEAEKQLKAQAEAAKRKSAKRNSKSIR